MNCKFCNTVIPDGSVICPNCRKPLNEENGNAASETPGVTGNTPQGNPIPSQPPVINTKKGFMEKVREIVPVPVFIILSVILVCFLALLILIVISVFKNGIVGKLSISEETFDIQHDAITYQTSDESYTLNGTITTGKNSGDLTLNGDLIATVTKEEGTKAWSTSMQLNPGENTFVITFSDNMGQSKSEIFTIERTVNLKYKEGTVLTKLNKSGVYIRPTPAVGEKYIIKIDSKDYKTELKCVGEEYTDSEGYIWCRVRTPSNGIGWVRSDLMQVKK